MRCENCGGTWTPPKNTTKYLDYCPFCGFRVLNPERAQSYSSLNSFLQYLVLVYGKELYKDYHKLNNLICDLAPCDKRLKRVYSRAILEDKLSQQIYELSDEVPNDFENAISQMVARFSDNNFYSREFGEKVLREFIMIDGMIPTGLYLRESRKICSMFKFGEISNDLFEHTGYASQYFFVRWDDGDLAKECIVKEGTLVIGDFAFANSKLSFIVLPDSIRVIGRGAFYGCKNLKRIVIPPSVTSLNEYVFMNCESLTRISIPSSVINIGKYTFRGCKKLEDISISSCVMHIGRDAFSFCSNLESVFIPSSVACIDDWTFYSCENLTSVSIPSSVLHIGESAFEDCVNLKNVVIPPSVKDVDSCAFGFCESLTDITIPSSVLSIGKATFVDCLGLSNITIPPSVMSIGQEAFGGCENLISISIPSSVKIIEEITFAHCCKLKHISIPSSTDICYNAFGEEAY